MCHYCFDTLLKELQKEAASSSSTKSSSNKLPFLLLRKQSSTTPLEEEFVWNDDNTNNNNSNNNNKPLDFTKTLPSLDVECPLFVTWEKRKHHHHPRRQHHQQQHSHHNNNNNNDHHKEQQQQTDHQFVSKLLLYELRGCIGTLSPKPVATALGEYALLAALQDRRFDPIRVNEIAQLRVAVSLLIQYEECEHCHDWTVGVHGIMIRFDDPNHKNYHTTTTTTTMNYNKRGGGTSEYSATCKYSYTLNQREDTTEACANSCHLSLSFSANYIVPNKYNTVTKSFSPGGAFPDLPEVAQEQGWNQQVTVKSLIRKAGWHGAVNDKLLRSIQCTRYQSSKYKLTYDDYVAQRGGMDPVQRLLLLMSSSDGGEADMTDHHHNAKNEGGSGGCCVM